MKRTIKNFSFLFLILFLEIILYIFQPEMAWRAWQNSFSFALEIFGILLPMLLLLELFQEWIPLHAVKTYLGQNTGFKGLLTAILLGSVAAGPLITAFPVANSMANKGARTANVVIFLGSWAALKLPLLIVESRYLGLKFSILRLTFTIPFLLLIGIVIEKFLINSKKF